MGAKRNNSCLPAVSLATLTLVLVMPANSAFADNSLPGSSGSPNPGAQQHFSLRSNIYSLQLPPLEEKAAFNPAPRLSGGNVQQDKFSPSKSPEILGLHWSTVDSHPGVAYRLNNSQDVQVHVNGRGAGGNFSVHF